jgi:hypothetical protein
MKRNKRSFVYFIRCGALIKVGRASDVEARLKVLQIGNPEKLSILYFYEGGSYEEARLHKIFHEFHVQGEWFRADVRIMDFIQELRDYEHRGNV